MHNYVTTSHRYYKHHTKGFIALLPIKPIDKLASKCADTGLNNIFKLYQFLYCNVFLGGGVGVMTGNMKKKIFK